jgi:hypothetical protein
MRIALTMTKKLQLSVSDYYTKMWQYVDELAATGAPLHDDELITYLLVGLGEDYNPVFTTVVARTDPILPRELYAQLLSFEQHTSLQAHDIPGSPPSAMMASRGHGYSGECDSSGGDCGHGRRRGRGPSSRGSFSSNNSKLTMHETYTGTDQIHAANGSGMDITRIGTSIVPFYS